MKVIINATMVMRDYLIPNGALLIENGVIKAYGKKKDVAIPEGCEVIDAKGHYVGPGFVDIHTHSDGKTFFYEDPSVVAHHLRHGSTTVLAALYFSMNTEEFVGAMKKIRTAMEKPECMNLAGIYMEGPYMNPKFGCNLEHNPWNGPINKEKYQPIIDAGWDIVKVWGLAPERENILQFVTDVKKRILLPCFLWRIARHLPKRWRH